MSVRVRENRDGVCLLFTTGEVSTYVCPCARKSRWSVFVHQTGEVPTLTILGSPFDNSSRLLSDMLTSCVMCYGILFIQFLKSGGRVVSLQRTKDSLPYVHELDIPKMLNLL